MKRTARCCCGNAQLTVKGSPSLFGVCHCDNCKQRTGSAFGLSAYFNDAQIVQRTGEFQRYRIRDEQERFFCTHCGTTLYWTSSWQANAIGIAAGCFTENPLPEPSLSLSSTNKTPWVVVPEHWDIK